MKGVHWETVPGRPVDAIPVHVKMPEEEEEEENTKKDPDTLGEPHHAVRRRARITRADIIKMGFTIGCPGCRAISSNAPSQNHTEACRARIETAMLIEGGEGAKRIAEGQQRFDEHRGRRRKAEEEEKEEVQSGKVQSRRRKTGGEVQ